MKNEIIQVFEELNLNPVEVDRLIVFGRKNVPMAIIINYRSF